jgi:hypothetical protein
MRLPTFRTEDEAVRWLQQGPAWSEALLLHGQSLHAVRRLVPRHYPLTDLSTEQLQQLIQGGGRRDLLANPTLFERQVAELIEADLARVLEALPSTGGLSELSAMLGGAEESGFAADRPTVMRRLLDGIEAGLKKPDRKPGASLGDAVRKFFFQQCWFDLRDADLRRIWKITSPWGADELFQHPAVSVETLQRIFDELASAVGQPVRPLVALSRCERLREIRGAVDYLIKLGSPHVVAAAADRLSDEDLRRVLRRGWGIAGARMDFARALPDEHLARLRPEDLMPLLQATSLESRVEAQALIARAQQLREAAGQEPDAPADLHTPTVPTTARRGR